MKSKQQLLQQMQSLIKQYCDQYYDFAFKSIQPKLRLHEPTFNHEEIFAALQTFLSTQVSMGAQVQQLEQECANYFNCEYGLLNNSGSSANLLAIAALTRINIENNLQPGDEVIVPALTWSTSIWPLIQYQLIPVFVDCDLDTLNIDIVQLEQAITAKTKAIMPVHIYGNPCDMDAVIAIAQQYNLQIIEDCCEAMGARYKNNYVGSFGRVSSFSFYYSHHITTLEGGLCLTNDFSLSEMIRIIRAHGWSRQTQQHEKYAKQYANIDPRFIFVEQGYNLRMTEVQAAIGLQQLPKLENIVQKRRDLANFYLKSLDKFSDFFSFQSQTVDAESSWFGFSIILKKNTPFSLQEITSFLQNKGIETRPIIAGNLTKHPGLQHYLYRIAGNLANADVVMQRGFAIANHHAIDLAAREYVIAVFDEFISLYTT